MAKNSISQHQLVADVIIRDGRHGDIDVSDTAVVARVNSEKFLNRKSLTVFNNGTDTIYWGYDNTVSTTTGTPLFVNQLAIFAHGPDVDIWLVASSGTHDVRITEGR